jgi:hypothetical protein
MAAILLLGATPLQLGWLSVQGVLLEPTLISDPTSRNPVAKSLEAASEFHGPAKY